jgi:DNA end-binding protein Ku
MAARPIWTGTLSFGLLNIPVSLMTGERQSEDIHFRMLDSRNRKPVKYERVNAETGEEVPWKEIVKAYEYEKGHYVVIDPADIKEASPQGRETVEVEAFVDADEIDPRYFEKPYVLVPGKKAEKGYVLLRETLERLGKVGIAKVVLRTREYLCAVRPQGDALVLLLMRFPDELVDVDEYALPSGKAEDYRISKREMEMAQELIAAMGAKFDPSQFKDEFTARLRAVINRRIKEKGATTRIVERGEEPAEDAATNVVDFMSLLKKSLENNKRTPAAKKASEAPARKATKTARKAPARTARATKAATPARKTATRARR